MLKINPPGGGIGFTWVLHGVWVLHFSGTSANSLISGSSCSQEDWNPHQSKVGAAVIGCGRATSISTIPPGHIVLQHLGIKNFRVSEIL